MKRNLMKEAHKLTKEIKKQYPEVDYKTQLGLCLSFLSQEKEGNEMVEISIGTENAALTAFTIPVISTFIAISLSKQIKKYNDKQVFLVEPVYLDKNLLNIEISSIFQIKMIHIINTICIVNKKRKGDKNERTSNRRPYDYGYEQY